MKFSFLIIKITGYFVYRALNQTKQHTINIYKKQYIKSARTLQRKNKNYSGRKQFHSSKNDDKKLSKNENKLKKAVNEMENKEEKQRVVLNTTISVETIQYTDSEMSVNKYV